MALEDRTKRNNKYVLIIRSYLSDKERYKKLVYKNIEQQKKVIAEITNCKNDEFVEKVILSRTRGAAELFSKTNSHSDPTFNEAEACIASLEGMNNNLLEKALKNIDVYRRIYQLYMYINNIFVSVLSAQTQAVITERYEQNVPIKAIQKEYRIGSDRYAEIVNNGLATVAEAIPGEFDEYIDFAVAFHTQKA